MTTANDIKVGNILDYKNELCRVIKQPEHIKPGKGPAYIQAEMKNIKTGIKLNTRFSSKEKIEKVVLEPEDYQYLYTEQNKIFLMNKNTFEQREIDKEILGEKAALLADGMDITLELYQDKPFGIILPTTVICEIEETEPVIKGAAVTASYKPAKLINGLKVAIPSYIVSGEKIKIKTEDLSYVERVK